MTQAWVALALALLLLRTPAASPDRLAALRAARRVEPVTARPGRLRIRLAGGFAEVRGTRSWRRSGGWLIAAGAATVALLSGGPALALGAAVLAGTAWRLLLDLLDGRAAAAGSAALLAAVRAVVAELCAGSRPGGALAAAATVAGPHAAVFAAAARAADAGDDAGAVLGRTSATRALATAWALGQHTGAPLAPVLERVAADLTAGAEQRQSVAVALSGPRASAVVLAGLPAVGLALGVAMGARPAAFLLSMPPGRLVCCVGVLLDAAGVWWVRHIVRAAERSP